MAGQFQKELEDILRRYGRGKDSNTADRILAGFIRDSIIAFNKAVKRRDNDLPVNYGDQ